MNTYIQEWQDKSADSQIFLQTDKRRQKIDKQFSVHNQQLSKYSHHSSFTNVRIIPPATTNTEISDLISWLVPFSKSRYHSENPQLTLSQEICYRFKLSILKNSHYDFQDFQIQKRQTLTNTKQLLNNTIRQLISSSQDNAYDKIENIDSSQVQIQKQSLSFRIGNQAEVEYQNYYKSNLNCLQNEDQDQQKHREQDQETYQQVNITTTQVVSNNLMTKQFTSPEQIIKFKKINQALQLSAIEQASMITDQKPIQTKKTAQHRVSAQVSQNLFSGILAQYTLLSSAMSYNVIDSQHNTPHTASLQRHFQAFQSFRQMLITSQHLQNQLSVNQKLELSMHLLNLLRNAIDVVQNRLLQQLFHISFEIKHFRSIISSYVYLTSIMRQLTHPQKTFEKKEIVTVSPVRKLLVDWDILIIRLREVRIKMTKAMKSQFTTDLIWQECLGRYKNQRHLFSIIREDFQAIENNPSQIAIRLKELFLTVNKAIQLHSQNHIEVKETRNEILYLTISLILNVIMKFIRVNGVKINAKGGQQMQSDLKFFLQSTELKAQKQRSKKSLPNIQTWKILALFFQDHNMQKKPFLKTYKQLAV